MNSANTSKNDTGEREGGGAVKISIRFAVCSNFPSFLTKLYGKRDQFPVVNFFSSLFPQLMVWNMLNPLHGTTTLEAAFSVQHYMENLDCI